jgi:16S rRNA (guanine1207-N2)-methyltransferase
MTTEPGDPIITREKLGASGKKPGHYFSSEPSVASAPMTVELTLPDVRFTLRTDRGVFAGQAVDVGSKLLLLSGPEPVAGDSTLVDIGAGYGPIALTLAARNPDAIVYAVEINSRARQLCATNARNAGLNNVKVITPDEFPEGVMIDRIWSNPPIRIGKKALHELMLGWLKRLEANGSAHLVVQKHLGSDSLAKWLETQGYLVERRGSKKAFRLLDVSVKQ